MCEASMKRFEARLQQATIDKGNPLNLDPKTIGQIAKLVFFPEAYGKPSFSMVVKNSFGIILTGSFIAGAVFSLVGAPYAGIVLSGTSLTSNTAALQNNLPKAENALRKLDFSLVADQSYVRLDLTEAELALN
jgi:flavin-binding protein dodecin